MSEYIHRFEPGADLAGPTLLLLHGTGGDENDLLPLGRDLSNWNLLSPRGNVPEGDAARFFRRLREGVFDEDDVRFRANELADWIGAAAQKYGFNANNVWALGYSNGANIAAATLMLRPAALRGAALWRGMLPLTDAAPVDEAGRRILLLSGREDPFAPLQSARALSTWFKSNGAEVTHTERAGGHGLQAADIEETRTWLASAA